MPIAGADVYCTASSGWRREHLEKPLAVVDFHWDPYWKRGLELPDGATHRVVPGGVYWVGDEEKYEYLRPLALMPVAREHFFQHPTVGEGI